MVKSSLDSTRLLLTPSTPDLLSSIKALISDGNLAPHTARRLVYALSNLSTKVCMSSPPPLLQSSNSSHLPMVLFKTFSPSSFSRKALTRFKPSLPVISTTVCFSRNLSANPLLNFESFVRDAMTREAIFLTGSSELHSQSCNFFLYMS